MNEADSGDVFCGARVHSVRYLASLCDDGELIDLEKVQAGWLCVSLLPPSIEASSKIL